MRRGTNYTGPWCVDDKLVERFGLRARLPATGSSLPAGSSEHEHSLPAQACVLDLDQMGGVTNGCIKRSHDATVRRLEKEERDRKRKYGTLNNTTRMHVILFFC